MLISGIQLWGKKKDSLCSLRIKEDRFCDIVSGEIFLNVQEDHIHADGCMALPGFINSHDHLDFNNYPQLGNPPYGNYREWGSDIHKNCSQEIEKVSRIPLPLRMQWGLYKNLLAGFTTVVNHGDRLQVTDDFIEVIQPGGNFHSVGFQKNWKRKLLYPFAGREPVVIHIGEGTDAVACEEIDELIRWNIFRRPITGVHGVAMNLRQARAFKALIWCPASNDFMFGKTADVQKISQEIPILFGSDSTLTSAWDISSHLRLAAQVLPDTELIHALGSAAAEQWQLYGKGNIVKGAAADLLLVKTGTEEFSFRSFKQEDIMLVMREGRIRLLDAALYEPLKDSNLVSRLYSSIEYNGRIKYVTGDLPALMQAIRQYHPGVEFPIQSTSIKH